MHATTEALIGRRRRWFLLALDGEVDLHAPHSYGHTDLADGRRADTVELLSASKKSFYMQVNNPGIRMFHCHVNDQIAVGMTALYHVEVSE